jgi:hypothetical protein
VNVRLVLARAGLARMRRNRSFREFAILTARAFGTTPPDLRKLSFREGLEAYARFTRLEAERALGNPDLAAKVRRELREGAFAFGRNVARRLRIAGPAEGFAAARCLYRIIGIDLRKTTSGEMAMNRCFFSRWYSPPVCDFVSALDEGILAGLVGDGRLVFLSRITEGARVCRVRLIPEGTS